MIHRALPTLFLCGALSCLTAGELQSPSFRVERYVFNAGGAATATRAPSSTGFRVVPNAIGDPARGSDPTSASFHVSAGFVTTYRPPGEVHDLRFRDAATLEWSPEESAGSYNLYRSQLADAGEGAGPCLATDVTDPGFDDTDPVPAGNAFLYLVTVVNRLAEEGTVGTTSDGEERARTSPCP